MPKNKNALIRYKTIDKCLNNTFRKWTLNNLIEACSDALYEYEGIDTNVSKRTIQGDIQFMRSDVGYAAPIIVVDRKYYSYNDSEFSITDSPLNDTDVKLLNDAISILKQFQGFSHSKDLQEVVKKIENKVYQETSNKNPIINFDNNQDLKGIEYLDVLYKAILNKQVLKIFYHPFKFKKSRAAIFHPNLLKEFNNRWFLVGWIIGKEYPMLFALDRITKIENTVGIEYYEKKNFNPTEHFKNTIGVSVLRTPPTTIKIKLKPSWAPYVITKPLHQSQKIIEQTDDYTIITLKVHANKEFISKILGFGDNATIIAPYQLRKYFKRLLKNNLAEYNNENTKNAINK